MRLVHYINEEKLYKLMIPKIKKECSKFIKDMRGAKGCLIRYDRKHSDWKISKNRSRDYRKPTSTEEELSKKIDNLFAKKFGWKARSKNVVFCWGVTAKVVNSITRYVFPAGDYKILWSPIVTDLFANLYGNKEKFGMESILDSNPELIKKQIKYFEENLLDSYTDKNIKKAVISGNEIMVKCKEYFLISPLVIDEVNEELNLKWEFLI